MTLKQANVNFLVPYRASLYTFLLTLCTAINQGQWPKGTDRVWSGCCITGSVPRRVSLLGPIRESSSFLGLLARQKSCKRLRDCPVSITINLFQVGPPSHSTSAYTQRPMAIKCVSRSPWNYSALRHDVLPLGPWFPVHRNRVGHRVSPVGSQASEILMPRPLPPEQVKAGLQNDAVTCQRICCVHVWMYLSLGFPICEVGTGLGPRLLSASQG